MYKIYSRYNIMYDIIVIGAGPAGLNAALYSLRGGKSVLIIESSIIGGQITNSPKLENFPTIKQISGVDFAIQFTQQVEDHGGKIEYDEIISIDKKDDIFTVLGECDKYQSKAVIIANGVKHKHINVPGEQELLGDGIYYCALCDGPLFEGKEVALIGDGNSAMQYALSLSNICSKVYLLTWMDKFFGDAVLEHAVRNRENIVHMPYTSVSDFAKSNENMIIGYSNTKTQESSTLIVSGVFVAIGQIPNNSMFEKWASLDGQGYFIANEDMSTNTPGLFVAGDCRVKSVRQVATAIADGAIASVSACKYIDSL